MANIFQKGQADGIPDKILGFLFLLMRRDLTFSHYSVQIIDESSPKKNVEGAGRLILRSTR